MGIYIYIYTYLGSTGALSHVSIYSDFHNPRSSSHPLASPSATVGVTGSEGSSVNRKPATSSEVSSMARKPANDSEGFPVSHKPSSSEGSSVNRKPATGSEGSSMARKPASGSEELSVDRKPSGSIDHYGYNLKSDSNNNKDFNHINNNSIQSETSSVMQNSSSIIAYDGESLVDSLYDSIAPLTTSLMTGTSS
jgi:hypothetical protein